MDAQDAGNIGHWISNLSASGVLMWVVWYVLSRALPDIIERHTAQNAADRKAFLDEMGTARVAFREEIAAERAHCAEELEKSENRSKAAFDALVASQARENKCGFLKQGGGGA